MSDPKPNDEEARVARAERLLRVAAEWEPEREAPADLTERALARMQGPLFLTRWASRFRHALGGWGLGTVGLATAALALVVLRPNAQADLTPPRSATPLESYTVRKNATSAVVGANPVGRPAAVRTAPFQSGAEKPVSRGPVAAMPKESDPEEVSPVRRSTPRGIVRPAVRRTVDRGTHQGAANWNRMMVGLKANLSPSRPPLWQEEAAPAPKDEYRVVMPVLFAQTAGDDSDTTAVPAVMELTFNQSARPTQP